MNPLKIVLAVKIIFTIFVWSLPLLLAPGYSADLLGIPLRPPFLFARLLGAAFFALLVGYVLGFNDLSRGRDARNTVRVGIVSNGLSFLLLLIFMGEWRQWESPGAQIYMWVSTAMTFLITAGLILFGVIYEKPARDA